MQLSVNADNRAAFSRHSRMLDFQRSNLYASILARSFLAAMPGPHVSADASKVQTQLRPLRLARYSARSAISTSRWNRVPDVGT